jgi:tRNA(Ile)-lysidine synthase
MSAGGTAAAVPAEDAALLASVEPPASATGAGLIVAFSGGLDSTVLLHMLARREPAALRVVHVHHGLQAAADAWAAHCAAFAASLGLPFQLRRVDIDAADPAGPEAAARSARYAALRSAMSAGDLLLTAHHRDDQAETLLLRLLRGSGLRGLAAMQPLSDFAPGRLWRPLLETPRAALLDYAQRHRLAWIEDPHNADPRYARSWLRRDILPSLQARFPQVEASLTRTAAHAAEAAGLLDELATIDLAAPDHAALPAGALSLPALARLSPARRRNLLRHWLRQAGFLAPDAALFERFDEELLQAGADAEPCLRWSGCELRRYRDALFALPPLPPPPAGDWSLDWHSGASLGLPPGCGSLVAETSPPYPLRVRFARAGERLRLKPGAPSRSLKNLFQERALPPWLRQRMPVIECDGTAALLPGLGLSTAAAGPLTQAGWQVRWASPPPGLR